MLFFLDKPMPLCYKLTQLNNIAMLNEETEKDIKRYLGILAEDFQGRIGFIIDEVKTVEERLNNKIDSEIKKLREDLTFRIIEVGTGLDRKIDSKIKAQMGETKKSIGLVEKGLSQEIKGLRTELVAHRNNTEMHAQRMGKKKTKESA